ncbi:MAG: HD domain-containing protein [Myxococcota bacterium]
MKPKLFRDPVHNIIAFDLNDSAEAVLFRLVQTRPFQRLRRVRQLGFANLVYHGAEHTRFVHSLGVAHVARRMLDALAPEFSFTQEERTEVLCAALLHDIGHGPFSHAIEKVTKIHHEDYSAQIVRDPDSEIYEVLSDVDPTLPDRVARYFGPRSAFPSDRQVFLDMVSSQLDADRLDYILRDGLATGVKIGVYDFERILTMLEPYTSKRADGQPSRRLAVGYRAREAVEGYLIARFHMFKQVYLHKAVRAAEKMLEAVLQRALELHQSDYEFSGTPSKRLAKLLSGERLSTDEYVSMDDTDVWISLKQWRNEDDPVLSELAGGLLDRRLYKTVDLDHRDPVDIARTIDRARQLAKDEGRDPAYTVLTDRASDTPYSPYDPEHGDIGAHIPIIGPDGTAMPIERTSDMVHLLGRDSYKILRLCMPADLREKLRDG